MPTEPSPSLPLNAAPPCQGRAAAGQDRHLRTDHLRTHLRERAVKGGVVTTVGQGLCFALYLATTIILTRLLPPEDFGLVAMVMAVSGFLKMFKDAGLSTVTVQKESITQAQVSNLFWINLGLGTLLMLGVAALAPAMAWFYRDPRLIPIALALSLTFFIGGGAVQSRALLNRQMRFKALVAIDVGAMTASLATGVTCARMGAGYYALVAAQLALALADFMLTWWISGWRPQRPTRDPGTRALVNFGANLTLFTFLQRLAQGADMLLLGRFYGAVAVGLYARASALLLRPLDQFITPFDAVFIPMLSRMQHQPERYRRLFLQAYEAIALLSLPVAGLMLALSRPLVLTLFGPQWAGAVPIFACFALAALYIPVSYAATWLPTTQGRGRDLVIAGVCFSVITLAAIAAGLPFGPVGVAFAYALSGLLVRLPVQFWIVGRHGPVRTADLWRVFGAHLPVAGATFAAAALAVRQAAAQPSVAQLVWGGLAGVLAGAGVFAVSPQRRQTVRDLVTIIRKGLLAVATRRGARSRPSTVDAWTAP